MAAIHNIVCDRPRPHVRVARFVRPDFRSALYDAEPITECELYRELKSDALAGLNADDAVVLNFGLLEHLPSVFFRLLMELRNDLKQRHVRLLLCGMQPSVKESFELMGGGKLFEVRATETRAVADGSA